MGKKIICSKLLKKTGEYRKYKTKKSFIDKFKNYFISKFKNNIFFKKKVYKDFNNFRKFIICQICRKIMVSPRVTSCGHIFCEYCIDEYLLYFQKCLICNNIINPLANLNKAIISNNLIDNLLAFITDKEIILNYNERTEFYNNYMNSKLINNINKVYVLTPGDYRNMWDLIFKCIIHVGCECAASL